MGFPKLYPSKPLSDENINKIIPSLRRAIKLKNMHYYDVFKLIDNNLDGFLTFDEFNDGIGKILPSFKYY